MKMALATNALNPECLSPGELLLPDLPKLPESPVTTQPPAEHGWIEVELNSEEADRDHPDPHGGGRGKLMHDEFNPVSTST